MMSGGCVSWKSKKQRTVALSSAEAEYMALSEATQEAVWLKAFLCELGEMSTGSAVKIYEDNQGLIALAKNPEHHKWIKHIDIRYVFVREKVEDGQVILEYISTLDMLANIMTNPSNTVLRASRQAGNSGTKRSRVEWECWRKDVSTRPHHPVNIGIYRCG